MQLLVMAKSPVTGTAKTRLGAVIGHEQAAEVAAAALLDTLAVCADAVGPRHCRLSLAGDLTAGVRGDEIARTLTRWTVTRQRGSDFAQRLFNAHLDAGDGVVVQVGMDTPQATTEHLADAASALEDHDVALGPADDGGWWVLARRDPAAVRHLRKVAMSTSTTFSDSCSALASAGLRVATTTTLRDVDTFKDAELVAAAAPTTHFAAAWARLSADGQQTHGPRRITTE